MILKARESILHLKISKLCNSYHQRNVFATLFTSNFSLDKLRGLNFTSNQFCIRYDKAFVMKTLIHFGGVKISFKNIHVVFWLNYHESPTVQY